MVHVDMIYVKVTNTQQIYKPHKLISSARIKESLNVADINTHLIIVEMKASLLSAVQTNQKTSMSRLT